MWIDETCNIVVANQTLRYKKSVKLLRFQRTCICATATANGSGTGGYDNVVCLVTKKPSSAQTTYHLTPTDCSAFKG